MAANLMAAEALIVARLRAELEAGMHVITAQDLGKVSERAQRTPAVHVVYAGPDITDDGTMVEIVETWYTVVAVRQVADQVGGQGAREDAAPLLNAVWEALFGWVPGAGYKELQPITPPAAGYTDGFGYYPLAWRVRQKRFTYPCSNT